MTQQTFNPIDYNWAWTGDWYEWDRDKAHKAALYDRNSTARDLRKQGRRVTTQTLKGQLCTKGGIGTGRPQISQIVSVYMLTVY